MKPIRAAQALRGVPSLAGRGTALAGRLPRTPGGTPTGLLAGSGLLLKVWQERFPESAKSRQPPYTDRRSSR